MESTTSSRITPLRDPEPGRVPQPPANTEAEQALLGAILVNNVAYPRVAEFLLAEHFSNALHGRIYAACGVLIERGQTANPVTLKNLFDQDGALAEIGGSAFLARLAESAVTIINAEHYGRTIHDLHLRRELITIGQDVVTDAFRHDLDDPAVEQIERAEQKLYQLATAGQVESHSASMAVAVDAAIAAAEQVYKADGRVIGITTGLTDLDRRLGGLQPTDLVVLAGRPSMGKSALATCIAKAAADAGNQVLFFSLEMPRIQLASRQLAGIAGISVERMRAGPISQSDMQAIVDAREPLARLPVTIDDTARPSVAQLHTRSRRHKRRHGLGLVVIDYLQLIAGDRGRFENRVQEVSEITRGLKAIAKELNVPVLALSQLNRDVERREDKRPMLADLRDSGSIEQDADIVIFLYRDEHYAAQEEPARRESDRNDAAFNERYERWNDRREKARNIAELLIRKNRNGATDTIKIRFDPERTWFDNLTWGTTP
jgi:replicative DNA helicase